MLRKASGLTCFIIRTDTLSGKELVNDVSTDLFIEHHKLIESTNKTSGPPFKYLDETDAPTDCYVITKGTHTMPVISMVLTLMFGRLSLQWLHI